MIVIDCPKDPFGEIDDCRTSKPEGFRFKESRLIYQMAKIAGISISR